jgi:hypothetical protein
MKVHVRVSCKNQVGETEMAWESIFTIKGKRSKGVKRQRKESDIQVETGVLFLFSVFFFFFKKKSGVRTKF